MIRVCDLISQEGIHSQTFELFFIIFRLDELCIGFRSYITKVKELSGNERSE